MLKLANKMIRKSLAQFYWIRLFLSIIFFTGFVLFFGYNVLFVLMHIVIIFLLLLAEFLLMWFLWNSDFINKFRFSKPIILIIPSLAMSLVYFLYLADVVVNKLWSKNINLKFVSYLLQNTKSFKADTGVSFLEILFIYIFLFLVTYLLQLFFVSFSKFKIADLLVEIKKVSFIIIFIFITFLILGAKDIKGFFVNKIYKQEPIIYFLENRFQEKDANLGIFASQKNGYFNSIDLNNVKKKNIILIVLDSARAQNFQMYGYDRNTTPFLNDLYNQGKLTKIDYAFSGCSESVCGGLGIFASKYYNNLVLKNASDSEILIQEILKKLSYKNYFISGMNSSESKWSESLGKSYIRDFDLIIDQNSEFNDQQNKLLFGANSDKMILTGLGQVPDKNQDSNFFAFWLMSTHQGSVKEKEFNVFLPTIDKFNGFAYVAGIDKGILINRYDNSLVQADYYISKIFELLQQKGYLDNSIVFIMGDHGESLGEKSVYGHLSHLYNEQMRIPLLIYSSDKLDIKNKTYATQQDVSATILDLLNIKQPIWWQGVSMVGEKPKVSSTHELANGAGEERVLIYSKGDKLYKYFYNGNHDVFDAFAEQKIYEMYSDPYENNNLINSIDPLVKNEIINELVKEFGMKR